MDLRIAGIQMSVSDAPSDFGGIDPHYGLFAQPPAADEQPIRITARMGMTFKGVPCGFRQVFDNQRSWKLYRKGSRFLLMLAPPVTGNQPAAVARFGASTDAIEIECDPVLFPEVSELLGRSHPFSYPLDRLLMMYVFASRQAVMVHGAGVGIGERGYLFTGPSGAGKSTLSRLLLARGHVVVSDERTVIRRLDSGTRLFGSPWPGEAGIITNAEFPLAGLVFVGHGSENGIRRIPLDEALRRLLSLMTVPWYDEETMTKVLQLCEELLHSTPCYHMLFTPTEDTVDFLTGRL